jgi:chromosome segregation ATPase
MKMHWLLCGSVLALTACENRTTRQGTNTTSTEQTQREVNNQASRDQTEAQQKAAKAQTEANEKAMEAQGEANHEMAKSQAKANENIREANQDLLKARNDYEVHTQKSVNEISNKIDQLKAKAQTAKPQAQEQFNTAMRDVDAKRTTLDTDFRALREQPQSFDTLRAKVDREMADLKKSVDVAQSKL